MNRSDGPLTRRLREAAVDRADPRGERVDDFVLEPDGVIDLRELDPERGGASIAVPAAALATILGRLGDAAEVSELYADPEPERARWRLGLRARHPVTDDPTLPASQPAPPTSSRILPPVSRLEMEPLARPETKSGTAGEAPAGLAPAPVRARPESASAPIVEQPGRAGEAPDEPRPTAECPRCAGLGRRDLFDRFSQIEYYSCDECDHMWQQDRR